MPQNISRCIVVRWLLPYIRSSTLVVAVEIAAHLIPTHLVPRALAIVQTAI
jgi:hypothetical protein